MTNREAIDVDRHVGIRIRERRISLGYTQQQLADIIGVTYQQAHKYERGINRVSAGRLYKIAAVLGVPISYFFEGLDDPQSPTHYRERICLEVARNLRDLPENMQAVVAALVRGLAQSTEAQAA